jgi:hypothetical protein
MELYGIFNNVILNEGRLEDAKEKYPNVDVDTLSAGDPSGNNKYLMWMARLNSLEQGDGNYSAETIIDLIQRYHKNESKLDNDMGEDVGVKNVKDINAFKTLPQLRSVVEKAEAKLTKSKAKKDAVEIYNKGGFEVVVPLTVHATCTYGKGSRWCIASGSPEQETPNSHFASYSKHSIFYIVKNSNLDKDNIWHKVAVQKRRLDQNDAGKETFWDKEDHSHSQPPSDWPQDLLDTIREYHAKAEEEILKAKLNNLRTNPSTNEYNNLYTYLTDEEKKWVIYKLVKNNPESLNNKELYRKLREILSEDDLYKLFREMKSLGTDVSSLNSDMKIVYRKFSRSAEQVSKEDTISHYLVLVKGDWEDIREFKKVDPNEPDSHQLLSQMKLKTKFESDLSLNGIITEIGLLDKYVGGELPTGKDLEAIKKKSKHLFPPKK